VDLAHVSRGRSRDRPCGRGQLVGVEVGVLAGADDDVQLGGGMGGALRREVDGGSSSDGAVGAHHDALLGKGRSGGGVSLDDDHRALGPGRDGEGDRPEKRPDDAAESAGADDDQAGPGALLGQRSGRAGHLRGSGDAEMGVRLERLGDALDGHLAGSVQGAVLQLEQAGTRLERHPWVVGCIDDPQDGAATRGFGSGPHQRGTAVVAAVVAHDHRQLGTRPRRWVSRLDLRHLDLLTSMFPVTVRGSAPMANA
jgi:hypothetical protein